MTRLTDLSATQQHWTLDEFVAQVNELLPHYLPDDGAASRIRDEINPRLVRHYASLDMLDEPLRSGREVRYEYRHLLQLLVVRRLLTEGYGTSAIGSLPRDRSSSELAAMIEGGVQLTLIPANPQLSANPALEYLETIRSRTQHGGAASSHSSLAQPPLQSVQPVELKHSQESLWTRLELLPGLELHASEDFTAPKSSSEQERLLQLINQKLLQLQQRRNK